MAFAIYMEWPGVTQQQYEEVMQALDLDQNPAEGGLFHAASLTPDGLRVFDVWETTEEFDAFAAGRLTPVVATAGITTEPAIEVLMLHNVYAPGLDVISEIGSTSMPDVAEGGTDEDEESEIEPAPAS